MKSTRVYLFDIDGTLLQTGGVGWRALTGAIAAEFGVEVSGSSVELRGRTDYAIVGDLLRLAQVEVHTRNRDRLLSAYHRFLADGLPGSPGRVLPGVRQVLEDLQVHQGARLGVLTGNGPRGAEIKLRHFDLWDRFTVGIYGDQHEDRSDLARAAVPIVRQNWGPEITADQICIIGDTPADVACAHAIGAQAIAVATGGYRAEELHSAGAHVVLESLEQWPFSKALGNPGFS
ncbi:MAG TPA: hypothetical protein DDY91_06060 [Planctomycetaceae bacterium]|jgi:phosphoglycolate phosphatase|nr:hypothetical protein [Planctomycetaceae bacterium]